MSLSRKDVGLALFEAMSVVIGKMPKGSNMKLIGSWTEVGQLRLTDAGRDKPENHFGSHEEVPPLKHTIKLRPVNGCARNWM